MAELKTKKNEASVEKFIESLADEQQRADSLAILRMMKKATKAEPKMWGPSIVGFGDCHYTYASGREGEWFIVGFAPRKQSLSLYLMHGGFARHAALLKKLGKHSLGKGCLYIKRLEDVDPTVLQELIKESVACAKGK